MINQQTLQYIKDLKENNNRDWFALNKARYEKAKELNKVTSGQDFKKYFGCIQGEKLSRPPRGYEPSHPEIELIKHKSFLAMHPLSDEQILRKDFLSHSAKVFKVLYPFNNFLNKARESIKQIN